MPVCRVFIAGSFDASTVPKQLVGRDALEWAVPGIIALVSKFLMSISSVHSY